MKLPAIQKHRVVLTVPSVPMEGGLLGHAILSSVCCPYPVPHGWRQTGGFVLFCLRYLLVWLICVNFLLPSVPISQLFASQRRYEFEFCLRNLRCVWLSMSGSRTSASCRPFCAVLSACSACSVVMRGCLTRRSCMAAPNSSQRHHRLMTTHPQQGHRR